MGRRRSKRKRLFQKIIRRFFGDDDVVNVTLAQPGGCDTQEAGVLLKWIAIID